MHSSCLYFCTCVCLVRAQALISFSGAEIPLKIEAKFQVSADIKMSTAAIKRLPNLRTLEG